jgi:spermidine/putrescine transport system substrate-binding protein
MTMHKAIAMTTTAALAVLMAGTAMAADIHVLNWKGYGTDEPWAVEAFEKATGNKVINDYFNSEQEMLTKLRTNPGVYDVVMINAAFNDQATNEGLIEPIDTAKIPNYADIGAEKAKSPMLNHDAKVYGVP